MQILMSQLLGGCWQVLLLLLAQQDADGHCVAHAHWLPDQDHHLAHPPYHVCGEQLV